MLYISIPVDVMQVQLMSDNTLQIRCVFWQFLGEDCSQVFPFIGLAGVLFTGRYIPCVTLFI